jgi:glycine/D-amino acid oxidase-like deaminating enzyme
MARMRWHRCRVFFGLLLGLRRHDFRSARTWIDTMYPGQSWVRRRLHFVRWALRQMWVEIPETLKSARFAEQVSRTPIWLADRNPLDNHPWREHPESQLPERAEVVVIGAGFTGAALAYHWSRRLEAGDSRCLVVLDMGEAASGASGRNEGVVVMGRYCQMVFGTVLKSLETTHARWTPSQREQLSRQFAVAYCRAAYRNADLIEQTIRSEGFDCDYVRQGWVQGRDGEDQAALRDSVAMALETGLADWTSIPPEDVYRRTGMRVSHHAGFSKAAATFHPAKWVWSLLRRAIAGGQAEFYSRTRVTGVAAAGEEYLVQTARGVIRAQFVVNATESYTPLLHPQFHDRILPTQTQAAVGVNGPPGMKADVAISNRRAFFGRHHDRTMVGSDATRVPDHEAGRIQPSRFITKYVLGELQRCFGESPLTITHEWSGTVGFTPDEYPVVGSMDGRRQFLIADMAGSGTGVSFNAARCIVNRILGLTDEPDDYPEAYFSPQRILDPQGHSWPELDSLGAPGPQTS